MARRSWLAPVAAAVLAFSAGWLLRPMSDRGDASSIGDASREEATTEAPGATGIGGVFFKSADPAALLSWYEEHLGITPSEFGAVAFQWREAEHPEETGYTIWSAFPDATSYFQPSSHPFMINFRVRDLQALIGELRAAGVEIVGELEDYPNGRFAWILDPEGRKVELWEQVPSSTDPYLR